MYGLLMIDKEQWTLEKESSNTVESLSINNILLRGCILKNTKGVFGAVISTGIDTKVEYVKEQYKWWQVTVRVRVKYTTVLEKEC